MKYTEIKIFTRQNSCEDIENFLICLGITSYEVEEPEILREILDNKEKYKWDYIAEDICEVVDSVVTVYLDEESKHLLGGIKEEAKARKWKTELRVVNDSEWKNKYKEQFKAIQLTETITVLPSWEDPSQVKTEKYIELDPGMAFGTGDHSTTSMCAKLMEKNLTKGMKVLDVGTGSAILAIAANFLGSKRVLGVDIDREAVDIAKKNVLRNNCQSWVEITQGDLTQGLSFVADLVVANLMAELVVKLTTHIKEHLNNGGTYICSGILVEKLPMVKSELEKHGFNIVEILIEGEWSAIAAKYE